MLANSIHWMWPLTAENITDLPLSNSLCANATCIAFDSATTNSQQAISWESQFVYANYVSYFFCVLLGIFILANVLRRPYTSNLYLLTKSKAIVRIIAYRRYEGKFSSTLNLPSLGYGLVILAAVLFSVVLCFIERPYYRDRRGYGAPPLGVRAGLAAVAMTPVVVILSGKYNLVTLLTGIGHEKLNLMHRWSGYITLFLGLVHTFPFIIAALHDGGTARLSYQFYSMGSYEYTGIAPLALLIFLALASVPIFRRKCYELFVHTHILAYIAYMGVVFWHTVDCLNSWDWLWTTVAISLVQWALRFALKTTFFELGPTNRGWSRSGMAKIKVLPQDMLELTCHARMHWQPGQHAFLRFPSIAAFDNHPFTITTIPQHSGSSRETLRFMIRVQSGLTRKLMVAPQSMLPVLIDGPYGNYPYQMHMLNRFDHILLCAGGGGVSAVLPWLYQAIKPENAAQRVQRVTLIWCIRHQNCLAWLPRDLMECLSNTSIHFELQIYISDASHDTDLERDHGVETGEKTGVDTSICGLTADVTQSDLVSRSVLKQRANLKKIIPSQLALPSTCILGCGPESMKIDLSNAAAGMQREVIMGRFNEVMLHTETFGW